MSQGSDSSEVLCSIVIGRHLQNTNSKIKIFKNFTEAITEYSTPSLGPSMHIVLYDKSMKLDLPGGKPPCQYFTPPP